MTTTVAIKSKPTNPTAWLEVTYSGLEPPVPLFDDLAMVGWTPPAIPPPPASAIDWTRPDPETGQAFTLSDYRVEGAVVEGPRGSGPLGRWTDADRRAHLSVLEGVLKRHGLLDQTAKEPSPGRVRGRAAAPPARRTATPAPPESGRTPVPGADDQTLAPVPIGSARVVATVDPAAQGAVAAALAATGADVTWVPVHRTMVHRYRGAESTHQVLDHLRLDAVAPVEAIDAVESAIMQGAAATGGDPPAISVDVGPPAERTPEPRTSTKLQVVSEARSA